jgi:Flp pilus assembly protein TadD
MYSVEPVRDEGFFVPRPKYLRGAHREVSRRAFRADSQRKYGNRMSVLFQALERAALEGHLPQQGSVVSYLPQSGARKTGGTLAFAVALLLAASFGAGGAYVFFDYAHKTNAENSPVAIAAADLAPVAPAQDKKAETAEESPPDLEQGITLSAPSSVAPISAKETANVMKSLSDAPAFTRGKTRKALKLEVRDSVPPEIFQKARAALAAQNFMSALSFFEQALERSPDNETALAGKALALQQTNRYAEAVKIERDLLLKNPKDAQIKANLIEALGAWGSPEAEDQLRQMSAKEPKNAILFAALSRSATNGGRGAEAMDFLRHAIELDPENAIYRLNLAILCDKAGKTDEAVANYKAVLAAKNADDLQLTRGAIEHRVSYLSSK